LELHVTSERGSSDSGGTVSSLAGEEYGTKNINGNTSDLSDLAAVSSSLPPKFRLRLPHHHHHRSKKNKEKLVSCQDSNSGSSVSSLSRESKKKASQKPNANKRNKDRGTLSGTNASDECSSASSFPRAQLNKVNVAKLCKEGEKDIESSSDGFFTGRGDKIVRLRFGGKGSEQNSSDEDGTVSTLSIEQQRKGSPPAESGHFARSKNQVGTELKSQFTETNKPVGTTGKAESSQDGGFVSSQIKQQVTESEYASSSASGEGTSYSGLAPKLLDKPTAVGKKRKAEPLDKTIVSLKRQKKADGELKADDSASLTTPEGQLAKNPSFTAEQAWVAGTCDSIFS
jgi:hypothetical protein